MIQLRDADLTWQEIEDEIVVLDLRSSRYFVVNGSGTQLWRMITQPRTMDELAEALAERCGLPSAAAMEDARTFVHSLRDRDLLAR